MMIKKSAGKIYGAMFTKNEQKAIDLEITRQIEERMNRLALDINSCILYTLMTKYGFGAKRLREFNDCFTEIHSKLLDYYEMDAEDYGWLCRQKLKEHGVDLEAWIEEARNKK